MGHVRRWFRPLRERLRNEWSHPGSLERIATARAPLLEDLDGGRAVPGPGRAEVLFRGIATLRLLAGILHEPPRGGHRLRSGWLDPLSRQRRRAHPHRPALASIRIENDPAKPPTVAGRVRGIAATRVRLGRYRDLLQRARSHAGPGCRSR